MADFIREERLTAMQLLLAAGVPAEQAENVVASKLPSMRAVQRQAKKLFTENVEFTGVS